MSVDEKVKLQSVIGLVDKMAVDPDIDIDYFIPGVLVTENSDGTSDLGGPYVQFTYSANDSTPHVQHLPFTRSYLEKTPEDLANVITSSLERFMEQIDSRQYGAQ